jgi:hypothetical protein
MAKPALWWAVLYDMGRYEVLKVTTERTHQVSGVRDGMIGAITVNRDKVVAKFAERDDAVNAIVRVGGATTELDREISVVDRQLQDLRSKRKTAIKDHFTSSHGAVR